MKNRDRVYKHFDVTNDEDAFDAINEHLDGDEGTMHVRIDAKNILQVEFTPFNWSRYRECAVSGVNRYDAMFNLMAALLDQKRGKR
jgi:hypothetical protein